MGVFWINAEFGGDNVFAVIFECDCADVDALRDALAEQGSIIGDKLKLRRGAPIETAHRERLALYRDTVRTVQTYRMGE